MIRKTVFGKDIDYDHTTGKFYNRFGRELGWVNDNGYVLISINSKITRAHRLAFYCITGEWPDSGKDIDHINGVRSDNRFDNLRIASRSENLQNQRKAHKDNRSGYAGVSRLKNKYWFARICVAGKTKHLGYFKTAEAAHEAYKEAKKVLHPFHLDAPVLSQ